MTAPSLLFTSESVTEGHPDKMCDQISDAVLDALLERRPTSTRCLRNGRKNRFRSCYSAKLQPRHLLTFDKLVRQVVNEIGFDDSSKGFDGNTCGVQVAVASQSPDIAQGVDRALEYRKNGTSEAEIEALGCWRPGDDVWLRLQRNRRFDAIAHSLGPQIDPAINRSP